MEAEYIALSLAMQELIAYRVLLKEVYTFVLHGHKKAISSESNDISYNIISCTRSIMYENNEACLKFATMPKISPQTKHITIPYHFFCSKV